MCLNNVGCSDSATPGVWWRDNADWKQYDAAQSAAVLNGVAEGASRVDLGYVASTKHGPRGERYVVDLCAMKQTNLTSGYVRNVKVVVPSSPVTSTAVKVAPVSTPTSIRAVDGNSASVRGELLACKKSICSLQNMVLKLESELLALKLQVLNDTQSELQLMS